MFRVALADWLKRHPSIRKTAGRLMAALPPSVKMGKQFWYWYSFYRQSESWSPQRMREHQLESLRNLLRRLSDHSFFYRERLSCVDIEHLDNLDDYAHLVSTTSRSEFADNYDKILSDDYRSHSLSRSQTSGTTGKALQFYHTTEDQAREWAAICHQWSRVGYQPGKSRRVEFRGLTSPGSLVDYFPERNMIRCSILNLKPDNVRHYAGVIGRHKSQFYHGYPSALHLLAQTIVAENIAFPQPEAVLLASEEIYPWQLQSIQQAFPKAKLFAHYGCAERTVLAGWCEHRREYHVLPQYSLVEIDPESSEIIGTNLYNHINGFVRYRMTDTVMNSDFEPCPDCGRPYLPRLIDLGGRSEDYLYSVEKGWIPPAIVTYPLKSLKAIKEVQFVQDQREAVVMKYICHHRKDDARLKTELDKIRVGLHGLFGNSTSFKFELSDDFPRSKSGKFKWIVCKLDGGPSIRDGKKEHP
ncbi:MAG: hypothetical protein AB1483_02555 [Candidatus Zixiibacteriota bacterium]